MVKLRSLGGLCAMMLVGTLLGGCYASRSVDDHTPVRTQTEAPMTGRPTLGMPISVPGQSTVIVPFSLDGRKGLFDDRDPYTKGGSADSMRFRNAALSTSYAWNTAMETRWHNAIVRDLTTGEEWQILDSRGVIVRSSMMIEGGEGKPNVCRAMLFVATVDDTNRDGMLNDLDASVAILTDADGRHPRVISPPRAQVWEARFDDASKSVYLLMVADTNRDGKFDTRDAPVPYMLPISATGIAQPVVSEATLKKVEGLLN